MTKKEQRDILFGKTQDQILSGISQWNNDTACLPLAFPKQADDVELALEQEKTA